MIYNMYNVHFILYIIHYTLCSESIDIMYSVNWNRGGDGGGGDCDCGMIIHHATHHTT